MQADTDRDCRPVLKLEVAPNDLAEQKYRLLEKNGVRASYGLPLKRAEQVLKAARIVSLSKVGCCAPAALRFLHSMLPCPLVQRGTVQDEIYNLQTDELFTESISPRNEAAALAMLLDQLGRRGQLMYICTALSCFHLLPAPSANV